MPLSLQDWVKTLTARWYPVLPFCIRAAKQAHPDAGLGDLRRAYATDPLLAARIFSSASRNRQPLATLEQAPSLLGYQQFVALGTATGSVVESLGGESLSAYLRAIQRAYYTACLSRKLAEIQGYKQPLEFFYAGLLGNVGEVAIRLVAPGDALRVDLEEARPRAWNGRERAVLGVEVRALSAVLAKEWCLPELLAVVLTGDQKGSHPKARLVQYAAELLDLAAVDPLSKRVAGIVEELSEGSSQTTGQLMKLIFQAGLEAARVMSERLPGTPADSVRLLLYPPPFAWPQTRKQGVVDAKGKRRTIPPGNTVTPVAPQAAVPKAAGPGAAGSGRSPPPEALDTPVVLSAHRIIQRSLDALGGETGIQRAVLAILNEEREQIIGRYYLGIPEDSPLRQLRCQRRSSNLFSQLLKKPQSLWVTTSNRERIQALITPELEALLGGHDFYSGSVFVDQRPLGVLYADGDVDETGYAAFKQVIAQLSTQLEAARRS